MAEIVQGILEDSVPDLNDLLKREIFTQEEINSIISSRRDLEYKLMRNQPQKKQFYSAIQYEIELEDKRQSRKDELNLKPSSSDRSIIRRILSLFKRFASIFKHDIEVWKDYINFCIRSKSHRDLSQVLASALQLHSSKEDLWLIARYVEEKVKNDIDSARSILQRSVEMLPKSKKLWMEYFKFEVTHSNNDEVSLIIFKYALIESKNIAEEILKFCKQSKLNKSLRQDMRKLIDSENIS